MKADKNKGIQSIPERFFDGIENIKRPGGDMCSMQPIPESIIKEEIQNAIELLNANKELLSKEQLIELSGVFAKDIKHFWEDENQNLTNDL